MDRTNVQHPDLRDCREAAVEPKGWRFYLDDAPFVGIGIGFHFGDASQVPSFQVWIARTVFGWEYR